MSHGRATNRNQSVVYDKATGRAEVNPRAGLLRKLPPTAGRVVAFEEIHQKLAIATELFESLGDDGRAGTYRALTDVVTYFTSLGIPHATLLPIAAAAAAIVDAEDGVESRTFRPLRASKGGKPRKASQNQAFEGILAVVTECCVLHFKAQGRKDFLNEATRLAAKLVNESPLSMRVDAARMREVREAVRQSKGGLARDTYDIQMQSRAIPVMPLEVAKALVSHDWVVAQ